MRNVLARLVTALATCPCPSSWSEGKFFLASASPNDNDSEEYGNPKTNGVIKLRLLCADEPMTCRASCVKCSLVCDPKSEKRSWLDKNIKRLSICERSTNEGERAVFVVASITFGFSVWCITHKLFKDMSSSAVKILPFK